jgi:hypothetical protein
MSLGVGENVRATLVESSNLYASSSYIDFPVDHGLVHSKGGEEKMQPHMHAVIL